MITLGLPYPPDSGTRIRDFKLLREISFGAQVSLCSLLTEEPPADIAALQQLCQTVDTYNPGQGAIEWSSLLSGSLAARPVATRPFYFKEFAHKIHSIVTTQAIDVVQIEHSFLACYRDAIPAKAECRTALSFHNIGSLQYRRIASLKTGIYKQLGFRIKAALMSGWEARCASRFDRTIVVSKQEGDLLRESNVSLRPVVIENGVDCVNLTLLPEHVGQHELFFIGVLGYPPNADGVVWFAKDIWPSICTAAPDVRLNIAGHSPPPNVIALNDLPNVTVQGFVEDVLPYYEKTTVVIVPLRAGGGTRLKILEAMAFGRPVVSTSIGCEGLDVVSGEHLLIADESDAFAAAVVRLLGDPDLRQKIAANARKLVEERYDWRVIGGKLLKVYSDMLTPETPPC
jgi:glycosyltransferase involved in cell wall biosynthesis